MVIGAAASRVRWTTVLVGLLGGLALAVGFNVADRATAGRADGCPAAGCDVLTVPEAALLTLLGERRAESGCVPLRVDSQLQAAAASYARALSEDPAQASARLTAVQATAQARAEGAGYRGDVKVHLAVGLTAPGDVAAAWDRKDVAPAVARSLSQCGFGDVAVAHLPAQAGPTYGAGVWVLLLGDA